MRGIDKPFMGVLYTQRFRFRLCQGAWLGGRPVERSTRLPGESKVVFEILLRVDRADLSLVVVHFGLIPIKLLL